MDRIQCIFTLSCQVFNNWFFCHNVECFWFFKSHNAVIVVFFHEEADSAVGFFVYDFEFCDCCYFSCKGDDFFVGGGVFKGESFLAVSYPHVCFAFEEGEVCVFEEFSVEFWFNHVPAFGECESDDAAFEFAEE